MELLEVRHNRIKKAIERCRMRTYRSQTLSCLIRVLENSLSSDNDIDRMTAYLLAVELVPYWNALSDDGKKWMRKAINLRFDHRRLEKYGFTRRRNRQMNQIRLCLSPIGDIQALNRALNDKIARWMELDPFYFLTLVSINNYIKNCLGGTFVVSPEQERAFESVRRRVMRNYRLDDDTLRDIVRNIAKPWTMKNALEAVNALNDVYTTRIETDEFGTLQVSVDASSPDGTSGFTSSFTIFPPLIALAGPDMAVSTPATNGIMSFPTLPDGNGEMPMIQTGPVYIVVGSDALANMSGLSILGPLNGENIRMWAENANPFAGETNEENVIYIHSEIGSDDPMYEIWIRKKPQPICPVDGSRACVEVRPTDIVQIDTRGDKGGIPVRAAQAACSLLSSEDRILFSNLCSPFPL